MARFIVTIEFEAVDREDAEHTLDLTADIFPNNTKYTEAKEIEQ